MYLLLNGWPCSVCEEESLAERTDEECLLSLLKDALSFIVIGNNSNY